jgi:hypothetical protein
VRLPASYGWHESGIHYEGTSSKAPGWVLSHTSKSPDETAAQSRPGVHARCLRISQGQTLVGFGAPGKESHLLGVPRGCPGGWLLGPKDGTPNARGLARGMPPVWDSGALESTLGGSVQVGWRRSDGQQADRPENADPLMTRAP